LETTAVWSPGDAFYETHFAPQISWFTGAELPDLSHAHPEQRYWLKNFLLNQITHRVPRGVRELTFAQLRKSHAAFNAYAELRSALGEYGTHPRSVNKYMALLDRAEIWLTFTAQAFELSDALHKLAKQGREHTHASPQELKRLRSFYVASKHVPAMVAGAQFRFPDPTIFWFNAEGLKTRHRGLLLYGSFAHLLRQLAQEAESFASYIRAAQQ